MGTRKYKFKKLSVTAASLALVLCTAVGGTLAWLIEEAGPVVNTFTPANVSSWVSEEFDGASKTNVQIQNTGNVPAYIRARIIATWKDAEGSVYGGPAPVPGVDYNISGPSGSWTQNGGYYYYNAAVAPQGFTDNLIGTCTVVADKAPEGYDLSIEIIADAIQSKPADARKEAWGYSPGSEGDA